MSQEHNAKRRRPPPPKRSGQGSKRPRTVFNLDDVTIVASPEARKETIADEVPHLPTSEINETRKEGENEAHLPPKMKAVSESQFLQPENTANADGCGSDSEIENLDGVTDQSGPWWTWAENQHALEGWAMGKLDKMIKKAEREEERKLMNHYDEKILMHQLLHNIEQVKPKASLQEENDDDDEESDGSSEDGDIGEGDTESETDPSAEGNQPQPNEISPDPEHPEESQTTATATTPMVVEFDSKDSPKKQQHFSGANITTVELPAAPETALRSETKDPLGTRVIRRALPKWIPKREPHQRHDKNPKAPVHNKERLFTPQEFETFVIKPLMHKLPNKSCEIKIHEDFPGDENNSYLLEAKIFKNTSDSLETKDGPWEHLQATSEAFLRSRISGVNLRWLLEDGASLHLDLSLSVHEPMGMRFSRFTLVKGETAAIAEASKEESCPPGLWINRVEPDGGIARALGNHAAFCRGCALLSANGTIVRDPLVLRKLLMKEKAEASSPHLSIKICLSRHADLSAIPLSKLTQKHFLQRRDGKAIDYASYPELGISSSPSKSSSTGKSSASSTSKATDSNQPLVRDPKLSMAKLSGGDRGGAKLPESDKGDCPSPRVSKKFFHPSFPQHLQAPRGNKALVTAKNDKEIASHPSYLSLQASKELVEHPSFQKIQKKTIEKSKELSSKISVLSSRGVPIVKNGTIPAKPNEAKDASLSLECNSPNKSFSDKSMSESSDTETSVENVPDTKIGNNALNPSDTNPQEPKNNHLELSSGDNDVSNSISGRIEKDSVPSKHLNDDRPIPTSNAHKNFSTNIPSNSTSENNSEMTHVEDKPLQNMASNTPPSDPVRTRTEISTSTIANSSTKDTEEKGGKQPLQKQISDGSKEKSNKDINPVENQNKTIVINASIQRKSNMVEEPILSGNSNDIKDKQVAKNPEKRTENDNSTVAIRRNSVSNASRHHNGSSHYPVSQPNKRYNPASAFYPFEVTLDTRRPLGGFFRTERGQNFNSKCTIFSICPGGQLDMDGRIKIGTQVTAVMVGERRIEVTSHTDVKSRYNETRSSRIFLRLILQNSQSCKIESAYLRNANWSSIGDWIGNIRIGWPGGVSIDKKKSPDTTTISNRQSALPPRPPNAGNGGVKSNWDAITANTRLRDAQAERSSSPTMGSFSPSNDSQEASSWEKSFSPRLGSFSPIATMEDVERLPNDSSLNGEDPFVDAIRNKSWMDLIDVIERGPDFSDAFVLHVLNKQYTYVAAELKKSNSGASDDGTNSYRLPMFERLEQERKKQLETEKNQDLEAKKKILKIYINIAYLTEKAMTLRNWTEVMIQIKSLQLFHPPSKHDPQRSKTISTKVRRTSPDVDLCHLPAVSIDNRISYASNNGFSLHNNHKTSLENRKLVVEISEGDPKIDQVQPKNLGQFVLAMNEIESQW